MVRVACIIGCYRSVVTSSNYIFYIPLDNHLGAVAAMHDAIALANLLYAMPATTSLEMTKVFEEYQKERYPAVMESFKSSQQ